MKTIKFLILAALGVLVLQSCTDKENWCTGPNGNRYPCEIPPGGNPGGGNPGGGQGGGTPIGVATPILVTQGGTNTLLAFDQFGQERRLFVYTGSQVCTDGWGGVFPCGSMVTLVTESPAMRSDIQIAFNNGQAFYATIINTITVQTGMGWVTYWVI